VSEDLRVQVQHVRVLEAQMFDPPRRVEVEHNDAWHTGYQRPWRLCDDSRGWMAEVRWSEQHEWGLGTQDTMVEPDRVPLRDGEQSSHHPWE